MGFIQDINEVFGKWFNGEHLREDEVEFIIYNIIILVLIKEFRISDPIHPECLLDPLCT